MLAEQGGGMAWRSVAQLWVSPDERCGLLKQVDEVVLAAVKDPGLMAMARLGAATAVPASVAGSAVGPVGVHGSAADAAVRPAR